MSDTVKNQMNYDFLFNSYQDVEEKHKKEEPLRPLETTKNKSWKKVAIGTAALAAIGVISALYSEISEKMLFESTNPCNNLHSIADSYVHHQENEQTERFDINIYKIFTECSDFHEFANRLPEHNFNNFEKLWQVPMYGYMQKKVLNGQTSSFFMKIDEIGFPIDWQERERMLLYYAKDNMGVFEKILKIDTSVLHILPDLITCRNSFEDKENQKNYKQVCYTHFVNPERLSIEDSHQIFNNILDSQSVKNQLEAVFIQDHAKYFSFMDQILHKLSSTDSFFRETESYDQKYGQRIRSLELENKLFAFISSFKEPFSKYLQELERRYHDNPEIGIDLIWKLFPWFLEDESSEVEPIDYLKNLLNTNSFKEFITSEKGKNSKFFNKLTKYLSKKIIEKNFIESFKELCKFKNFGMVIVNLWEVSSTYGDYRVNDYFKDNENKTAFLEVFVDSPAFDELEEKIDKNAFSRQTQYVQRNLETLKKLIESSLKSSSIISGKISESPVVEMVKSRGFQVWSRD